MSLTGRPPYQKPPKETPAEKRAGKERMRRVKMLPCVICGAPPPSDVHHCISDRFSTRRASDRLTIPLCKRCHQVGPTAIHVDKRGWEAQNGPDHGFLDVVRMMLEEQP